MTVERKNTAASVRYLGGPALAESRMLFEVSDLATKLRDEKKRKADQVIELQKSSSQD